MADQPVNYTPNVLNGHVSAFAQVGDLMIAGGTFSKVEQDGTVYKRHNLVAFSATTGEIDADFHPNATGVVYDLQVTADQLNVVVVGNFSSIDHAAGTSRIAELTVAGGDVVPGFQSPQPNDTVRDIALANGVYYVSGEFTKMDSHSRRTVAAIDMAGADTGLVDLDVRGNNNGGQTKVQAMDISADGTSMVLAGNFSSIDGLDRGQVAVVDLTPTSTTLDPWDTHRFTPKCGPRFDTYMRDVAIDPAGAFFVIVATGGPSGFQKSGLLCDSASRWELSPAAGQQPTWIDYTGGDTLTATIVDTNVVYIGGHMRWVNNSFGHNHAAPGAVGREGVAALDPANGLPLTWNPGRRRGYGVFGFALTADGLWTGSDTTGFGGELRGRIAFCRIVSGEQLPPYKTATLPGSIITLGEGQSDTVASRGFGGANVDPPVSVASTQNWQNSHGTFLVDGVLYSGWTNGSLRAEPFDGTTFGAVTGVNLHHAFPDLPSVKQMFFDRDTHRLYYTRAGFDSLFYRYFQPESQTVGSFRYRVTAPGDIPWTRVAGAFIAGSHLFYTNAHDGGLYKVTWDSALGATVGAPTLVLNPGAGDPDLRSAGLILSD